MSDIYDHVESRDPWKCFGLTARKLQERGVRIDEHTFEGCEVYEVERHHAVLGETYETGCGMSNYVTTWPWYVYDPRSDDLREVEGPRKPEANLDADSAAESVVANSEWKATQTAAGAISLQDCLGSDERIVHNSEDVRALVKKVVDDLYLEDVEIEEHLSEEDKAAFYEKYRKAITEKTINQVLDEIDLEFDLKWRETPDC